MKKIVMMLLVMAIFGIMLTGCSTKGAEDTAAKVAELEAKIQELEDVREIMELKNMYGYYADTQNVEGSMSLFVDDAVCDFGPFGVHDGAEAIEAFWAGLGEGMTFTLHMMHNPVIKINGDTATGEWYYEVPGTFNGDPDTAAWIAGKYESEMVRIDGQWKFKKVVANWYYNTPYDTSWTEGEGMLMDPSPNN